MGSVSRTAGGIVAGLLIQAGLAAAPSSAFAEAVVNVPCGLAALRTAIDNANAAGSGVLRLASYCNYSLTTPTFTTGTRGDDGFYIEGDITIIGGRSTTISRSASASSRFRVFEIAPGAKFQLQNVFVSGGDAEAGGPGVDTGGGILNNRGEVLLDHVTVTGNTADSGAGISNNSGRMHLNYTLVTRNTIRPGGGGGGGAYNDGELLIAFSRFSTNTANTHGGGVFNKAGWTSAYRATLDANTAGGEGGALYNAVDGRAALEGSLIIGQTAGTQGGGIYNAGALSKVTLASTDMAANSPDNCGGTVTSCAD